MILKSIELNNIRSYKNNIINFPEGSILLSGDIGSGKTTILLAVEFALFGLSPELKGSSLLRNGSEKGFVRLKFRIKNKNFEILRILKRTKTSVLQDSGSFSKEGEEITYTALELKSKIFNILGYPQALISKSKNLIYRFTVFTPQESVKQILFDTERIETIRRLFNIDKYKRVRENSSLIIRNLKNETKILESKLEDKNSKKELVNHKQESNNKLKIEISKVEISLGELRKNLKQNNEELKKLEDNFSKTLELKERLNSKIELLNSTVKEKEEREIKIASLKKELISLEFDPEQLKTYVNAKLKLEDFISKATAKLNFSKEKITNSNELTNKIDSLKTCPFCKQEVTQEHKEKIIDEKNKTVKEQELIIQELNNKTIKAKNKLEIIIKKKEELELIKSKVEFQEFKKKQVKELNNSIKLSRVKELENEINSIKEILNNKQDSKLKELKEKTEILVSKERTVHINLVSLKKESEGINEIIQLLNEELEEKKQEQIKLKLIIEQIKILELLTKSSIIIEKKVLRKVHTEFNELFKSWFQSLINDEVLSSKLDEDFNPVIYQNGYEADLQALSGGEKTAVAFSYRLSMNKVVNDVLTHINTKNLLILDEPTDGFSEEQLDNVREVLDQLNSKQLIIVSHEPKLESFVDSVLKIEKSNHISTVL